METERAVSGIERTLSQGKALVRAPEALETIEPTRPIERVITWLALEAYRRHVWAIIGRAPAWICEAILNAGERIGDDRAVLRMSEN